MHFPAGGYAHTQRDDRDERAESGYELSYSVGDTRADFCGARPGRSSSLSTVIRTVMRKLGNCREPRRDRVVRPDDEQKNNLPVIFRGTAHVASVRSRRRIMQENSKHVPRFGDPPLSRRVVRADVIYR